MRAFIDEVKAHDRIFLIGVGREGMATRAFAMRLMHMGKRNSLDFGMIQHHLSEREIY